MMKLNNVIFAVYRRIGSKDLFGLLNFTGLSPVNICWLLLLVPGVSG